MIEKKTPATAPKPETVGMMLRMPLEFRDALRYVAAQRTIAQNRRVTINSLIMETMSQVLQQEAQAFFQEQEAKKKQKQA